MAGSMGITTLPSPASTTPLLDRSPPHYKNRTNLTRAFYIPYHTNKTTHLPIYDVTSSYRPRVKGLSVGSPRYKAAIRLMPKPSGNAVDDEVRFLINFDLFQRTANLVERTMGRDGFEMNISLPSGPIDDFSLKLVAPYTQQDRHVNSFLREDSKPSIKRVRRSSFAIEEPIFGGPKMEWRAFPFEAGSLTYGLYEVPDEDSPEDEPVLKALYVHCRLEAENVVKDHSEGILLLPDDQCVEDDVLVASSLVGSLWANRADFQRHSTKHKGSRLKRCLFRTSL